MRKLLSYIGAIVLAAVLWLIGLAAAYALGRTTSLSIFRILRRRAVPEDNTTG